MAVTDSRAADLRKGGAKEQAQALQAAPQERTVPPPSLRRVQERRAARARQAAVARWLRQLSA